MSSRTLPTQADDGPVLAPDLPALDPVPARRRTVAAQFGRHTSVVVLLVVLTLIPTLGLPVFSWSFVHDRLDRAHTADADGPAADGSWERTLSTLIDDLDSRRTQAATVPETAVGLRFELARPSVSRSRYARWGDGAQGRARLKVRPVARGSRGRWVKSALGWSDVAYADRYPSERYPQAHLDLLRELAVASRSGSRHGYSQDNAAERDVHAFGPSLWRLLREAEQQGLPLVPGSPPAAVRVATMSGGASPAFRSGMASKARP